MGILDDLGGLARQFASGNAPAADVHAAYDQVSQTVPQSSLADGLAHAFNSDQTLPFGQMLSGLFNQSSPDQKAALLNQIIAKLGPGGVSQILSGAGAVGLGAAISGGSVTPAQAQQVSPEQVQVLAQNAAKKDPSIVDAAAAFYAQHPTLVKAIGAGALAMLVSHISQARR